MISTDAPSIKPTQAAFADKAYDLTDTSLALSDQHPNIVRRGGKAAGRESEYTYQFGEYRSVPLQS
jgi:centromeric protein E